MADIDIREYRIPPIPPAFNLLRVPTTCARSACKSEEFYERELAHQKEKMGRRQALLYAGKRRGLVFALQAMDAGGKDGLICHVMTGLNPQGCRVTSFKRPTPAELKQSYLQRHEEALPERGIVAVWNRSHYEEVGVVRVHPRLLRTRGIDPGEAGAGFWTKRLKEISRWEAAADSSGVSIVKIFLHISKEEQAKRLIKRGEDPERHWKFNPEDITERAFWGDYMEAYGKAIAATSTDRAPWYVIPADDKRAARLIAARIINHHLKREDLSLPRITARERKEIKTALKELRRELKKQR